MREIPVHWLLGLYAESVTAWQGREGGDGLDGGLEGGGDDGGRGGEDGGIGGAAGGEQCAYMRIREILGRLRFAAQGKRIRQYRSEKELEPVEQVWMIWSPLVDADPVRHSLTTLVQLLSSLEVHASSFQKPPSSSHSHRLTSTKSIGCAEPRSKVTLTFASSELPAVSQPWLLSEHSTCWVLCPPSSGVGSQPHLSPLPTPSNTFSTSHVLWYDEGRTFATVTALGSTAPHNGGDTGGVFGGLGSNGGLGGTDGGFGGDGGGDGGGGEGDGGGGDGGGGEGGGGDGGKRGGLGIPGGLGGEGGEEGGDKQSIVRVLNEDAGDQCAPPSIETEMVTTAPTAGSETVSAWLASH